MKFLCVFLGVASFILAAVVFIITPSGSSYGTVPLDEYIRSCYHFAAASLIAGGFFWLVLGRILSNQEEILRHFKIKDEGSVKSPLRNTVL